MNEPTLAAQPATMSALLEAFIPAAGSLDAARRLEVLQRADATLSGHPQALRRQIGWAIRGLAVLGLLRFGRGLGAVPVARRRVFLNTLQDGPILKLRLAVWGLRTLAYAGYYGDPERQREIGYHPSALGWAARREVEAS